MPPRRQEEPSEPPAEWNPELGDWDEVGFLPGGDDDWDDEKDFAEDWDEEEDDDAVQK